MVKSLQKSVKSYRRWPSSVYFFFLSEKWKPETYVVESSGIKWNQVKSSGIKWNQVESSGIKWNQVKSSGIKWNQVESSGIKLNQAWNQVESTRIKWNQVESIRIKWNQVESSGIKICRDLEMKTLHLYIKNKELILIVWNLIMKFLCL